MTERRAYWLATATFVGAASAFMWLLSLLGYRLESRNGAPTVFVYNGLFFAGFVTRLVFDRLMKPKDEEIRFPGDQLSFAQKVTIYLSLMVTILFTVSICIIIEFSPMRKLFYFLLEAASLATLIALAVRARHAIVSHSSGRN